MKKICFATAFALFMIAQAQTTIAMVKDINPTGNSEPGDFIEFKGKMYFRANDGVNDDELWVTDGTESGTKMLKNINAQWGSWPYKFTVMDDYLFFIADDSVNGEELWVTDGTEAGTRMVKDINPTGDSNPGRYSGFITYNHQLYFAAYDGDNGVELWVSDGTEAGTKMVKDIHPTGDSESEDFAVLNGKLYFRADDGVHGAELWVTDGTEAGTKMVKDIRPGADSSEPYYLTVFNEKLYFEARDASGDRELWTSDGTATGTQLFKNINLTGNSNPWDFTVFNGKMYFQANNGAGGQQIWVTDGTAAGTQLVIMIMSPLGSTDIYSGFTAYNGKLYFSADNGNGDELWSTDGTFAGTQEIKDINPDGGSVPENFVVYGNKLYFKAVSNGQSGGSPNWELYETDGTAAGTKMIEPNDAVNGNPLYYSELYVYDGALYFGANYTAIGSELYKVIDPNLSLADFAIQDNFHVYPNPTKDILNISTSEKTTFSLYDLTGKQLKTFKVDRQAQISIADLTTGIYILKDNQSEKAKKVIKQ